MNISPLLGPAAILVLWSLVVLAWLIATRLPAFSKAGITLATAPRGSRYADVEKDMPEQVNWVTLLTLPLPGEHGDAVLRQCRPCSCCGATPAASNAIAGACYAVLRIALTSGRLVNIIRCVSCCFSLST